MRDKPLPLRSRTVEALLLSALGLLVASAGSAQAPTSSCVNAVQGEIAWNYQGNTSWSASNVGRLCQGAEDSVEPARCFERVMHGGVDWGGGTRWEWRNALALCQGTRDADATITCFEAAIDSGAPWREAIDTCRYDAVDETRTPTEGDAPSGRLRTPTPPLVTPDVIGRAGVELEIDTEPWEGDLQIVDVELEGPLAPHYEDRVDPTFGLLGREYALELEVRNVSARAVRAAPMYVEDGRVRSAGARFGGEVIDPSVNLPAGETTTVQAVLALNALSPAARERVIENERFETTVFLADPDKVGDTVESRLFEDTDVTNHRREVDFRVIIPYEVRLEIDDVTVRHPCTDGGGPADRLLLFYVNGAEGTAPLNDVGQLERVEPGASATASVMSNEDLSFLFAFMPASTAPDGSWTSFAEGEVSTLRPLEWKRPEPVAVTTRLEATRECGGESHPVEVSASLHTRVH